MSQLGREIMSRRTPIPMGEGVAIGRVFIYVAVENEAWTRVIRKSFVIWIKS
jgi:hypothetical protein